MDRIWLVSYGAAWILTLAQGFALLALFWAVGRIHLRSSDEAYALITDEGPEIDAVMPEFEGCDTNGRRVLSRDYREREYLLLLLSPECAPCENLLRDLRGRMTSLPFDPEFLIVMEGPKAEAERVLRRHRLTLPLLVDESASLRRSLGVGRTPYGFLVDGEGIVRMKGVINNGLQLQGLLGRRGQFLGGLFWQSEQMPAERDAG